MTSPIRTLSLALPVLAALASAALPAQAAADAHAGAPAPAAASMAAAGAAPAPAAGQAAPAALPAGPRVSAPTRAALETLLHALPPGSDDGLPRQRVTARKGETVDALIKRTMADSPFKEAFLRGAFLELNAAALEPGTTRLAAGAQLQLPNLSDLREHLQRVLGPQPGAARAAASAPPPADRRAWVRFP
ncbi:hypothetical protein ACT80S_12190 [Ramlibacter sp. MAHUQ-53]|uniref:hypothetical protein n=1 Tax=unclassified Ramlibacter TaxID=2617605 RepID=UPI003625CD4B